VNNYSIGFGVIFNAKKIFILLNITRLDFLIDLMRFSKASDYLVLSLLQIFLIILKGFINCLFNFLQNFNGCFLLLKFYFFI